ncbi:MAG: gliding motility protein GldM [Saprospiraceae bacterium]|nr:gliding motility protein GldM [Saprospiraceae bacterium]
MSIPKEPRQLMINLMYLVLTALLALNVSAEVMNAFFSLDRGLTGSRKIVEASNEVVMTNINKQADAYKTADNEKYRSNAKEAIAIANEFSQFIDGIRTELFAKAGGPSKKDPLIPKDIRNKDVTTRMFVLGENGKQGLGFEIERKVKETREKLLALADNNPDVAASFPLALEEIPKGSDKTSWADFRFRQMPVAACFPILGKIQSDAKTSSAAVLNYCLKKVAGEDIKFDAFQPAISAPKGYVIAGDKYEADVFLSAYSTQADNISISVDGRSLPLKDGIAKFETGTSSTGTKSYKVVINVKNPLTGENKPYTKEFQYEVGQRSCSVQLDKMNVFYIGVDNPITVSAAGVSTNDLKVSASGVNLTSAGGSKYTVRASTPGEATITLSGGGLPPTKFTYKVKRIPDPIPLLGAQKYPSAIPNGTFKAQSGIAAVLENFDFDAKCDVVGYTVAYQKKRADVIEKPNTGARYNSDVQDMVQKAAPGDVYYFLDIKAKCPGDQAGRKLGDLVFKIR